MPSRRTPRCCWQLSHRRRRGGAAIVVVPGEGERWERIIDLRVEEGDDSLVELRRLLDRALGYREANRATVDRAGTAKARGLPESHVRMLALEDAVEEGRFADAQWILSELGRENPRWHDYVRTVSKHPEMESLARFLAETRSTGGARFGENA